MKKLLIVAFGVLSALAADGPVRKVTSQAQVVGGQPIPGFRDGYLFFLDGASVRVYSPEGFPAFVTVLEVPDATSPSAKGLAVDSDGSAAVAVDYQAAKGLSGGIAFLDATGRPIAFLNTGLYLPSNLSYGEDHSLWAFGWQADPKRQTWPDRGDYMMVRKYSPDRKEEGRYLARSLFPEGLSPGSSSWQPLRIAVAHDRVGLVAWSGNGSSHAEWVELALDGSLIRRVPIDNGDPNFRLAFTTDGHLYRHRNGLSPLLVLDQNAPVWHETGNSPGKLLWGAAGNLLVFSRGGFGLIDLEWFEQPALPALTAPQ